MCTSSATQLRARFPPVEPVRARLGPTHRFLRAGRHSVLHHITHGWTSTMGQIDGGDFYGFRQLCPSVTLATAHWHQSAGFPRSLSSSSLSVVFNYVRLPSRLSSPVPRGSILHGAVSPIPSRKQRADAMATGRAITPRMPCSRGLFLLMWLFSEKVKELMRLQTEETDGNGEILITADVEALPTMHCCVLIESARWVWIVKWDWDGCDGRAGPSHR